MGSNTEKQSKLTDEEKKLIRDLNIRKRLAYVFCTFFALGAGMNISVGMGHPQPGMFYLFAVLQIAFLYLENNVIQTCKNTVEHIEKHGLESLKQQGPR